MNFRKIKTSRTNIRKAQFSNAGVSLLSVIVASGIFATIGLGVSSMLTRSFDTQALLKHREEKVQLQRVIQQSLSCERTVEALRGMTCASSLEQASGFVELKNYSGRPIGRKTDHGYRKLGAWGFKGTCVLDEDDNRYLAVATLRVSDDNRPYRVPTTRKPYEWSDLYGINSPAHGTLCMEQLNNGSSTDTPEAEHLESKTLEAAGNVRGCGNGLLGAILNGGQTKLFRATITCEPGKVAVSGGVECMADPGQIQGAIGAVTTLVSGSPKGLVTATRPAQDGKGWYVECCLETGGLLGIGRTFPAPKGYAVCVDKP